MQSIRVSSEDDILNYLQEIEECQSRMHNKIKDLGLMFPRMKELITASIEYFNSRGKLSSNLTLATRFRLIAGSIGLPDVESDLSKIYRPEPVMPYTPPSPLTTSHQALYPMYHIGPGAEGTVTFPNAFLTPFPPVLYETPYVKNNRQIQLNYLTLTIVAQNHFDYLIRHLPRGPVNKSLVDLYYAKGILLTPRDYSTIRWTSSLIGRSDYQGLVLNEKQLHSDIHAEPPFPLHSSLLCSYVRSNRGASFIPPIYHTTKYKSGVRRKEVDSLEEAFIKREADMATGSCPPQQGQLPRHDPNIMAADPSVNWDEDIPFRSPAPLKAPSPPRPSKTKGGRKQRAKTSKK